MELASLNPGIAGYVIAYFAIFNALGRIVYRKLIDSKGFTYTATLNYISTIAATAILMIYPSSYTFLTLSPVIYLSLGGWLVIAPTEVRSIATPKRYSLGWPLIMTSYATSVFIGTFVAGVIRDITGSFQTFFLIAIVIVMLTGLTPLYTVHRKLCIKS